MEFFSLLETIQSIITPQCFTPGSNYSVQVNVQGATNVNWTFPNCPNGVPSGSPDPECWFNYSGNGLENIFVYTGQQAGHISVFASNSCGTSSRAQLINFCDGNDPPCNCPIIQRPGFVQQDVFTEESYSTTDGVQVYPNPVKSILQIELSGEGFVDGDVKNLSLVNLNGQVVSTYNSTSKSHQMNVESITPGIYWLKISSNSKVILRKIIVN